MGNTYAERVAQRVASHLMEANYNTVVLAHRIGLSPRELDDKLDGDPAFTVRETARIAEATGTDPQTFYPRTRVPE